MIRASWFDDLQLPRGEWRVSDRRGNPSCGFSQITNHDSRITSQVGLGIEPTAGPQIEAQTAPQKNNRDTQLRGRSIPVLPVRLRRWRARPFNWRAPGRARTRYGRAGPPG